MSPTPAATGRFLHDGYDLDVASGRLCCHYSLGDHHFTEEITVEPGPGAEGPPADAADAAARLVYLLAGVSYYKTAAPPVVDLGETATTAEERRFLREFYVDGLAEFAYRNDLDLRELQLAGPGLDARAPVTWTPRRGRPLVPFGGGIDSLVTLEAVRRTHPGASLFVVSRAGDRFAAIERSAAVTGLPVRRADRRIDPALLRSATHGFLNGHVPVTGILSAVAVLAAVLGGHDAVVMSNERSASEATLEVGGRPVNHQWSKSLAFEAGFRRLVAASLSPAVDYFSFLRSRSELWVAEQFASLSRYHGVFRSCNRAFHIDPGRRLETWCATCDKCCFIDLVLAPFMTEAELVSIFGGHEPLADDSLAARFRALLGTGHDPRPFECVGDESECRAALVLAARRPDRAGSRLLQTLAAEVAAQTTASTAATSADPETAFARLLGPEGRHFVPDAYAGHAGEPAGVGSAS